EARGGLLERADRKGLRLPRSDRRVDLPAQRPARAADAPRPSDLLGAGCAGAAGRRAAEGRRSVADAAGRPRQNVQRPPVSAPDTSHFARDASVSQTDAEMLAIKPQPAAPPRPS